jgi:hypothetical protein
LTEAQEREPLGIDSQIFPYQGILFIVGDRSPSEECGHQTSYWTHQQSASKPIFAAEEKKLSGQVSVLIVAASASELWQPNGSANA